MTPIFAQYFWCCFCFALAPNLFRLSVVYFVGSNFAYFVMFCIYNLARFKGFW